MVVAAVVVVVAGLEWGEAVEAGMGRRGGGEGGRAACGLKGCVCLRSSARDAEAGREEGKGRTRTCLTPARAMRLRHARARGARARVVGGGKRGRRHACVRKPKTDSCHFGSVI